MKSKITFLIACLIAGCTFTQCGSSKQASKSDQKEDLVSYAADISPLLERSCTPCHFPENGRKKFLDTYERTKESIEDIIARVELPKEHKEYMPFKMKKQPLSEKEIATLKKWVAQSMPE